MDPLQFLEDRLSSFPFTTLPFTYPTRLGINAAQFFTQSGKPALGQEAKLGGKPVYYAGEDYGYQSPESYKQVTGEYPKGFAPSAAQQPTLEQAEPTAPEVSTETGPEVTTPEGGPTLEGEGAKQEQEPITSAVLERLDRYADPEYQQEISRIKTRNLIEAASVLSALRAPRERQKQAAEIERQNIQAWRDIKAAQIEANARQQMALGLATVSAMTPNLSNYAEIYKASMQPFNIRTSRK
jgi:hypothetical protein